MPFAPIPEDEQNKNWDQNWAQDQAWMTEKTQTDHNVGGFSLGAAGQSLKGDQGKPLAGLGNLRVPEPARSSRGAYAPFSWSVFLSRLIRTPGGAIMAAFFLMIILFGIFVLVQPLLLK